MSPKDHAILLLAQGIPASQVAAAVGVSESYISQLRSDPDTAQAIAEKQAAASVADISFDATLARAEELALERVEKALPFANMGQALAAFRVLNGARRRSEPVGLSGTITQNNITVQLTLPANNIPRYITNQANEIVEVEGQTMLTATPRSLDTILAARSQAQGLAPRVTAVERAANLLDGLRPLPRVAPRRAPQQLSPDIL